MIKILHIIKSLGRGGAEMLLPETIKLHDSLRFSFEVIYFLPWKNQLVSALESSGAKVTCFPANNNLQIMFHAESIIRYIREHKIQLIHCHLPWAGFLGRYIFLRTGLPVIYTEHNKQERYHWITAFLNKQSFNFQSAVVAVSDDVVLSIVNNVKPKVPIISISNGVDTTAFKRNTIQGSVLRSKYKIPHDALVVGIVAVFRSQKRLKEWIQVFAQVSTLHPDLYGIIVGAGPLEMEIKAERKRLGLENKVVMPGLQTNTRDWYSAMDVFMMSSSFEGMPVAMLEAMSSGCATISTDAGGIKEIIVDEKSGLLVGVDEYVKLGACLEKMFDPDYRKQFSAEGRKRIEDEFTIEKMVRQLENVYSLFTAQSFILI